MIIGVTHDKTARHPALSVSTKVSIGLPPNGDRNHPPSSTISFSCERRISNRVGWEVDPELTEHYGDECGNSTLC